MTVIREQVTTPIKTGTGRYRMRIIDAGTGSSGIYPAATLEQAARDRVFPRGLRMHLDHPTAAEADDRPGRSVKDWVAVLDSDAEWNPATQALEADMRVFRPWQILVEDMAADVGLSIYAYAEATPTPEGNRIDRITEAVSVDFVTAAGRGGKILAVLENARTAAAAEATVNDRREQLAALLRRPDGSVWIRDFDDTRHIVWWEDDTNRVWQSTYTVTDGDQPTITGNPTEVYPVTTFVPVHPGGATQPNQEADMPQIEQAELDRLTEAANRVPTLEADLMAARQEAQAATLAAEQTARAATIAEKVARIDRPQPVRDRIAATLTVVEGDITDAHVDAAVKAEDDYLAAATPDAGRIVGFGKPGAPATETAPTRTPWGREIKEA